MEAKINIAAILKDKPKGTKLYSPIFGNLRYEDLVPDLGEFTVVTSDNTSAKHSFRSDSRYNRHGEPLMLLPSKEMRDWSKFAWKKGDVLVSNDGKVKVLFEKFRSDTYLSFIGKHHLDSIDETLHYQNEGEYPTFNFSLESENAVQTYINTIEERLGGKLNLKTLELEKTQPEFKDGDVVCISGMGYLAYCIVKSIDNPSKKLEYYVLNDMNTLKFEDWLSFEDKRIQPITETQQVILFKALANEGKAWNADKKEVIALKPLWTPKAFDKVLVRDSKSDKWRSNLYGYKSIDGPYYCVYASWNYCIPYEGNEHLLGTTKDVEG